VIGDAYDGWSEATEGSESMAVRPRSRPGAEPLDPKRLLYVDQLGPEYREAELEFRQLEYFLAVAEELHFGRAATRLYISQPALSQAIAGLERTLDVKLFVRTRQSVELTDAGRELVRHTRGMLSDRETAVASVRRVDRGEAGVLRLGVALLAEHQVAPAFAALAAECPEILLDRSTATSERLLGSLQSRDLHAVIVHQVPVIKTLEELEWTVIRRGDLAAVVSETSPLADTHSATIPDLSEETFLVPPRAVAPSAFEGLKTMCNTFGGFEPEVLEHSTLGADWDPVINGEAIALVPDGSAAPPEGTVAVPIEGPPGFSLAMVWRAGNGSPILHRFLGFMRAYSDEHAWAADPAPLQGA
jgi:DNA-binding transcriptional LysR family regulator